jgi:hypothetical protein
MHKTGHLNGNTGLDAADVGVEDNPYYLRRRVVNPAPDPLTQNTPAVSAEDEGAGPAVEAKPRSDRQRRLALACALLVLLAAGGGLLYLRYGQTTKIDHQIKAKPGLSLQLDQGRAQQTNNESPDQQILEAIKESQESRRTGGAPRQGETAPSVEVAPQVIPSLPKLQIPSDYAEPRSGQGGEVAYGGESASAVTPRAGYATRGGPSHGSSSIYAGEPGRAMTSSTPEMTAKPRPAPFIGKIEKAIPLPPYGEMLPVRLLGGLYTLRNSPARLELTRDVSGRGWELKKGTIFVAQIQSGLLDRAYLTITGFIDPATNRYVKVTGETLGDDGSPGLKGKRRQISNRWSRAFNRILNIAPGIAQAALARNGGTTVIVPAGGATSDLIGTGGFNFDRREFVEVTAGATGYVMVTDLPDTKRGVDANPTEQPETTLSDSELAELLSSGDLAKIKAAMPRMTPEMRQVAELVVKEK